ncbi:MBL fold metallo-hydrolase [Phreatobacter sp.]|uniref:MBL fold metallo-hydrolase n=1 Tax=Phreatobacter sp. TaxID=1966341 RepID=UPI003F71005C
MRVHFLGAAHVVTGSCFLIESGRLKVLVDCGMFQGSKTLKELNYRDFPFDPATIDAVLLTHAHIDHAGLLPKLFRAGFSGPIHATAATADLCSIMLPDSGHIQEMEVEQLNRRRARRGNEPVEPIYTAADAVACMSLFSPVGYDDWLDVGPGLRARWWNAGHILGSASIEIEADAEGGPPLRVLMSGDLGPDAKLFHPDPDGPTGLDLVVCEATYGDRDRPPVTSAGRRALLVEEVQAAAKRGGPLLIPCFAVERTQEILADLMIAMDRGAIPRAPVFLDSPLAIRASEIFRRHAGDLEEGETLLRHLDGQSVRFTESAAESRSLERLRGFHIIIAASGMAEAGRIRHHLKNHLWRPSTTVLFVGYQAEATLGRLLLDGAHSVTIQGDVVRVQARVRSIEAYSGHADRGELIDWLKARRPVRGAVALVHGEERAITAFVPAVGADVVAPDRVLAPHLDDVVEVRPGTARIVGPSRPARLPADRVGGLDWNNDATAFLLALYDELGSAADDKARRVILRRLKRALEAKD